MDEFFLNERWLQTPEPPARKRMRGGVALGVLLLYLAIDPGRDRSFPWGFPGGRTAAVRRPICDHRSTHEVDQTAR